MAHLASTSSAVMLASLGVARQTARRSGHALAIRQASSSATTTTTATAASSSSSAASKTANAKVTMPWEEYFKLRKSQRTWGTVAAIPTTITGVVAGGGYFANLETDPGTLILGIEPIFAYGIAVLGCVGLGWLSGPILGNTLWRLTHRNVLSKMETMDKVFLRHIRTRRVDPSRQSVNNPVPDYYGERVFSKKQYRQWLRDQAAYRRKATFGSDDALGPMLSRDNMPL